LVADGHLACIHFRRYVVIVAVVVVATSTHQDEAAEEHQTEKVPFHNVMIFDGFCIQTENVLQKMCRVGFPLL